MGCTRPLPFDLHTTVIYPKYSTHWIFYHFYVYQLLTRTLQLFCPWNNRKEKSWKVGNFRKIAEIFCTALTAQSAKNKEVKDSFEFLYYLRYITLLPTLLLLAGHLGNYIKNGHYLLPNMTLCTHMVMSEVSTLGLQELSKHQR